jgi:hypothetical protein
MHSKALPSHEKLYNEVEFLKLNVSFLVLFFLIVETQFLYGW